MSVLTNIAIPVIPGSSRKTHPGQVRIEPVRSYGDDPLPVKPSSHAPRQAQIVSRVAEQGVALYLLQIGDVRISNVGLDEILDYVSNLELEQFENRQFEEERELLRIAEAEEAAEEQAKYELQKQRAKKKSVVLFEEDDESSSDELLGATNVPVGKHGRARPSYTHLYKVAKERRRRKRDSETGEPIYSTDEELADLAIEDSSLDGISASALKEPEATALALPKRRRRKRDKVTGELLPLSPEASRMPEVIHQATDPTHIQDPSKRPRRRRHPITKELMPLGWRYDPDAEEDLDVDEQTEATMPPRSMDRDSRENKRLKFDSSAAASKFSFTNPSLILQNVQVPERRSEVGNATPIASGALSTKAVDEPKPKPQLTRPTQGNDLEASLPQLLTLKLQHRGPKTVSNPASSTKQPAPKKTITLASFLASNKRDQRSPSPSSESSHDTEAAPQMSISHPRLSTEHEDVVYSASGKIITPYRKQGNKSKDKAHAIPKTSITNPLASENIMISTESEVEDLGEDEWFVEAILDHGLSDPRTHPPKLGENPIMLYLTKWQGFRNPTWEPEESFIDAEIIERYQRAVGLHQNKLQEAKGTASQRLIPRKADKIDSAVHGGGNGYRVEAILSHHLSDPETHASGHGRTPVMLYQVKWVGYDETTWEPKDSFLDENMLEAYWRGVEEKGQRSNRLTIPRPTKTVS